VDFVWFFVDLSHKKALFWANFADKNLSGGGVVRGHKKTLHP
jgi:hypothetical protein